jgi:ornithine cyclodeaminase
VSAIPFYDAASVNRTLSYPELVERLRLAFLAPPIVPERMMLSYGDAANQRLLVMPAVNPGGLIGIKVVTVHGSLSSRPGGAVRALYVALDAVTGEPRALIEGASLTERRTAAASVLAATVLARPDASTLLVIGTGQIARALCTCYAAVMRPERIMVWGRSGEAAARMASELGVQGVVAEAVDDIVGATRMADIVSIATLAAQPLVLAENVRSGTHIDLVGGFTPSMREADDQLLAVATIVADGPGALETAGDLIQPIAAGLIDRASIRLLADVLSGSALGRTSLDEITVFKSVGMALEDLAAAEMLLAGTMQFRAD